MEPLQGIKLVNQPMVSLRQVMLPQGVILEGMNLPPVEDMDLKEAKCSSMCKWMSTIGLDRLMLIRNFFLPIRQICPCCSRWASLCGKQSYPRPRLDLYFVITVSTTDLINSEFINIGGGDKHVNIIFVKAPSHSSNQQTEVILPEQPQQKTVVYVLVKKPSYNNNVKVTGPGPARPQKPEVFFIRYADKGLLI